MVPFQPNFITFTGADDRTDINEMMRLSHLYPIEWGILLSPSRQGNDPRYPTHPSRFTHLGLRLAAHLCGEHSERIMGGMLPALPVGLYFSDFDRVQVNTRLADLSAINAFRIQNGLRVIVQWREPHGFPHDSRFDWLYDTSGGKGTEPMVWPPNNGTQLYGYAGGLCPDNVVQALHRIHSPHPFWIDMESGVRTGNDFDLAKCRDVCEQVFGRL